MIATVKEKKSNTVPAWHQGFLDMLPAIQRHAQIAFRDLPEEARDEAVAECVANCFVAYARLVELNKKELAFASVLARYGVSQTKSHRKVGGHLNARDLLSRYAQRRKGFIVERLDRYRREDQGWLEIVVEDRRAGPSQIAATRIDFANWLQTLSDKQRRIANMLATGETTTIVARKSGLSAGRISQLRQELKQAWEAFHDRGSAACA